jgi:predicted dehydrogenase
MMEKPPGLSVVETTELRDAAVAAGVKGMVAWNRRFHPIIAKAREMVLERGPITQVLGEFHKDMRSFIDENIAGANMSSGRLMRGEGRKREWFDGEEWHLGFPPHILDKMFMESPVHALDVLAAFLHAVPRRAHGLHAAHERLHLYGDCELHAAGGQPAGEV